MVDHPTKKQQNNNTVLIIVLVVVGGLFATAICGGVLVAILLPALSNARDTAKQMQSLSQLRGIQQALQVYAVENKERVPTHAGLLITQGYVEADVFESPTRETARTELIRYDGQEPPTLHYKFGDYYFTYGGVQSNLDARTIMVLEPTSDPAGWNVAFGDGRTVFVPNDDFNELLREDTKARTSYGTAPIDLQALTAPQP